MHYKIVQTVSFEQLAVAPALRVYKPRSVMRRAAVGDKGSYEVWITRTRVSSKEATVLWPGLKISNANRKG